MTQTLVPVWDVADRMRKSLREADVAVQEMADYLGVTRGTVSTWINGRIQPSRQTLRLWALRTGVPFVWLELGITPDDPSDQVTASSTCRTLRFPADSDNSHRRAA